MKRLVLIPLALSLAFIAFQPASAQDAASANCKPRDLEALAGWGGVWIAEGMQAEIHGREAAGESFLRGMKLGAWGGPWKDEGWRQFEAAYRKWDTGGEMIGWSFPLMMSAPAPFKFIIAPNETAIISQYQDIRYVYTDGRGHLPEDERWATLWGDSIGCWEGDTLVIETTAIKYAPEIMGLAPPLSEDALVVERIRLVAPDRIEAEFTITDPETLEHPWTTRMVYLRHPVLDRLVHEGPTLENDRFIVEDGRAAIGEAAGIAAPAEPVPEPVRLSIAELDRVVGTYAFDDVPFDLTIVRRGERLFFKVDPVQPHLIPIYPSDPLDYEVRLFGGNFRFTTDEAGEVTGFEGVNPGGLPHAGKRKPD